MAFFYFARTQRLHGMVSFFFIKKNTLPDAEPDEPLESRAATPDSALASVFVLLY
jgi:hypothetical protein